MASRLSRWAVASGLGLVAVFAVTLPPGPSVRYRTVSSGEDPGPSGAAGLYAANEGALHRARVALNTVLRRRSLLTVLPKGPMPIVVHFRDTTAVIDGPMTAAAESLWRKLPRAVDAPRVILVEDFLARRRQEWDGLGGGTCIAAIDSSKGPRMRTVRRGAGACAWATEFGLPGRGIQRWLDSLGSVGFPGAPIPLAGRGVIHTLGSWQSLDRLRVEGDLPWYLEREQQACVGGRREQCPEGLGFHGEGSRRLAPPWDRYRGRAGTDGVPAALLTDLGRERFERLWQSDDPVPATYERLTGRPFDQWAMTYLQDAVGRIEKDNGLTALGWLGWAFWMGLVVVWFAVRVERRSAT